jgi:hypothetical protein
MTYLPTTPHAEISVEGNSTATVIGSSSSDFSNKVQVTIFDTNGPSSSTMTPDHTTDDITVIVDGNYSVSATISFSGAASPDTISMALFKNNGTTQLGARVTRKLGTSGDVGACSLSAIVDLEAGDTIEIWVQNESLSNNITVEDASLIAVCI